MSVVIPCYNHAAFVGQAIESVLAQTHRDVEVIVVDDGSTDDSERVAKQYYVRVISSPHAGVCRASNVGFAASRGAFVMRLDADDLLDPTYIEKTLVALERDPGAQFAYTEGEFFGAFQGMLDPGDFDPELLAQGKHYAMPAALMRRAAFESVGGYDPGMTPFRGDDWDLWMSYAERGMRGVLLREPLWRYRQHATGNRNQVALISLWSVRREMAQAAYLQDKHPRFYSGGILVRRLLTLPGRLLARDVSPRWALRFLLFTGFMLLRTLTAKRLMPPHQALASSEPQSVSSRRR